MRVSFMHPMHALFPGGGGRVVHEYANYLARRGHTVNIFFPCPSNVDAELKSFSYRATEIRDWWRARMSASFRRLVGRSALRWMQIDPRVNLHFVPGFDARYISDADAIFATYWQTAEFVGQYPACKGEKFYLIQHYETWAGAKARVDLTWLAPLHKVVVSRWLYKIGKSLGATRMRYITNGINHEQFRVLQFRKPQDASVLSMYHTSTWKGTEDVIAVFARLHERYGALRISMFGLVPRPLKLPEWIQYFRDPSPDNLRDLYNGHAIYVGASHNEGWGLPPAEAMACGCAFVGTDIGGFREYATDGQTALLSPPGDRYAMFRNLCQMIDDSELRRGLQDAGRKQIQRFTWEQSGSKLEEYLYEVVAGADREARSVAQRRAHFSSQAGLDI